MADNDSPPCRNLIFDSLPVAMVTMDRGFKITSFNRKAEYLTGFSSEEAIGRLCKDILCSSQCDTACPLQTVLEQKGASTGLEAELINRFHEIIPVRIGTAAIESGSGDFVGYLEVIEDISREKGLEREKENFHFMLAHDMKSPLVVMQGLLKRLRDHGDSLTREKMREYFRIIEEAGDQLEAQVMEFLEYSRQASKKVRLCREPLELCSLIDSLVERHQQQAAEKRLAIHSDCSGCATISGDSRQLQRVFENLVDNSIKFADKPGKISIRVRTKSQEVVITVHDDGPGIAAEEIPYVFDAFHQHTFSTSGHGLGLAAVKSIVERHGGRVAVRSSLGHGATFIIRLPLVDE